MKQNLPFGYENPISDFDPTFFSSPKAIKIKDKALALIANNEPSYKKHLCIIGSNQKNDKDI